MAIIKHSGRQEGKVSEANMRAILRDQYERRSKSNLPAVGTYPERSVIFPTALSVAIRGSLGLPMLPPIFVGS